MAAKNDPTTHGLGRGRILNIGDRGMGMFICRRSAAAPAAVMVRVATIR